MAGGVCLKYSQELFFSKCAWVSSSSWIYWPIIVVRSEEGKALSDQTVFSPLPLKLQWNKKGLTHWLYMDKEWKLSTTKDWFSHISLNVVAYWYERKRLTVPVKSVILWQMEVILEALTFVSKKKSSSFKCSGEIVLLELSSSVLSQKKFLSHEKVTYFIYLAF